MYFTRIFLKFTCISACKVSRFLGVLRAKMHVKLFMITCMSRAFYELLNVYYQCFTDHFSSVFLEFTSVFSCFFLTIPSWFSYRAFTLDFIKNSLVSSIDDSSRRPLLIEMISSTF